MAPVIFIVWAIRRVTTPIRSSFHLAFAGATWLGRIHGGQQSRAATIPLAFDKTAYAAWVQNGAVHLTASDDGGVTWDHATRVTTHNTALYACSLELCGRVLHLVWPDTRHHGLAEPYYKRSTDGGATWSQTYA